jgi:hypothetical protein
LLKPGTKKDDIWSAGGDERNAGEGKNLGIEEVKVGAGTYADAIHTHVSLKSEERIDFYLVPKVGLVRFVRARGDRQVTIELKEFKPGK